MQTLKLEMRRLPASFTKDIRAEKLARTYAHVYDHYFGAGQSVYAPTSVQQPQWAGSTGGRHQCHGWSARTNWSSS